MKSVGILLASLLAAGGAFSAGQAAEVLRLNFDGAPVTDADVYTASPGDNVAAASLIQSYPWPGGATQPELLGHSITDSPPAGGFQGGNALRLNTNTAETRKGLAVLLEDPVEGAFTIEGIFYQETLLSGDARMEFEIQVWLQTWFIGDNQALLELRTFGPNAVGLPENSVDLATYDAPGGTEVRSTTPVGGAPDPASWHHVAIVYDGVDTVTVYVNDTDDPGNATILLSHTENWAAPKNLGNLIIGAWANDAGTARDFIGYVDAISISDEALDPADFVLLQEDTSVQDWLLL